MPRALPVAAGRGWLRISSQAALQVLNPADAEPGLLGELLLRELSLLSSAPQYLAKPVGFSTTHAGSSDPRP
jgi:hypothetical protein